MNTIRLISVCLIVATSVLSGCSLFETKDTTWKPVKQKARPLLHTVRWPGETLPMIAKWYTADHRNADALAYANPTINPERLRVGNRIFIPVNLIKKRNPLPETYIKRFNKKARPQKSLIKKPVKPKTKEDEFELFGPK